MKLSCKVTQDLLPLYHDGVCSDESRALVEEHLAQCADCKDVLKSLKDDLVLEEETEAAKPLLSIQMTWNKEKRKTLLKAVAVALVICIVACGAWWGLTQWRVVPVSGADLMSLDSGQFEDGQIYVRFCQSYSINYIRIVAEIDDEAGAVYFVPQRSVFGQKYELPTNNWAGYWFIPSDYEYTNAQGERVPVTAAYLGSDKDPENAILIWKEGMEMPEPSEEAMEIWELFNTPPEDAVEESVDLEPTLG